MSSVRGVPCAMASVYAFYRDRAFARSIATRALAIAFAVVALCSRNVASWRDDVGFDTGVFVGPCWRDANASASASGGSIARFADDVARGYVLIEFDAIVR